MRRWPWRYAPWMALDLARGPGLVMLVVAALATLFVYRLAGRPAVPGRALLLLGEILSQVGWPFVVLATAGIVSGDLSHGYYRTIFAKPVNPAAYYLQRWLLGAALVAAFVPLLGWGLSLTYGTFPFSWALLAQVGLLYLLLGGFVFLLSTLTRRAVVVAILVYILETVLHTLMAQGAPFSSAMRALVRALPPFHLTGLDRPLAGGGDLAHVLLYGGALVLGALAVLRFRPLGQGGRA